MVRRELDDDALRVLSTFEDLLREFCNLREDNKKLREELDLTIKRLEALLKDSEDYIDRLVDKYGEPE